MHDLFIYPIIGIFAGFVAGLLGLGGGTVIVPALVLVFPLVGIDHEVAVHMAIGTSMANVVVTQATAILRQHSYIGKDLLILFAKKLWPGIILGAFTGVFIADNLSSKQLAISFGVIVFLLAVRMTLKNLKIAEQNVTATTRWRLPHQGFTTIISFLIGCCSSILGMGGGAFMVPFLQQCRVPITTAMAASVLCGLPLALIASIAYLILGLDNTPHLQYSSGYIYWPAFFGIVITSMIFTSFGVKVAHKIPTVALRWLFVVFLLVVSLKMIFA